MKKTLALLAFLCISSFLSEAQSCDFSLQCQIVAPSGMRMRAQPNLKGDVVTYVPFDSALVACTQTFGAMTYEKIEGFWRKVKYKNFEGYMFDGFLKITGSLQLPEEKTFGGDSISTPTPASPQSKTLEKMATKANTYSLMTETYNYCGDVSALDPGMLWYAILPKAEHGGLNYRIKQVEVDVVLSKQKVGKGLEFDIITQDEERSIFLFGLNRPLDVNAIQIEDQSDRFRYGGRKVYPGQQMVLSGGKNPISLVATGSVEGSGPCPTLSAYKLMLKGKKYFLDVNQDMTKALVNNGQCGMPEVYWYGDLTGDDVPEVVFVSVYEDKNQFTLFVSNPNRDDILLEKSAEWTVDKCY
jgi:hypothetical protein